MSKRSRTHGRQMRIELGKAATHLHAASTHAAGSAARTATSGYGATRNAMAVLMLPLLEAIQTEAKSAHRAAGKGRKSRKHGRSTGPWVYVAGGLLLGAVTAAAVTYVVRRRRAATLAEIEEIDVVVEEPLAEEDIAAEVSTEDMPRPGRRR
jgi:hypothetical protein